MYFLPQIGWMRRLWHFGGHLPGILPWQERAGITMQRVWLRRKEVGFPEEIIHSRS